MKILNNLNSKHILIGCFAASIAFTSCGGGEKATDVNATAETSTEAKLNESHFTTADLVVLDLSSYGVPVITKAPKDSKVIKSETNGDISVYGGKFFKISFSQMEGTAEENMSTIKMMVADKELNPSFDKLEVDEKTGFLKLDNKGKLSFSYGIDAGGKTVLVSDGMPYDLSPDQFTDYTSEDIKVMFEAAKATVAK